MRYICLVFVVLLGLPLTAAAQHSPSLPPIGLPLPPITPMPSWERPQLPWWERQGPPPWERGHVARPADRPEPHRYHNRSPQVIYVMQPYPVAILREPPQVIVVQPVTRVEREIVVSPPVPPALSLPIDTEPPPPPYVPSGDRTLYVIPGCYVGNVSPKHLQLPAGCDLAKLTTYTP